MNKQQLEYIGFKEGLFGDLEYEGKGFKIRSEMTESWSKFNMIYLNYLGHQLFQQEIYPQSLADIETLIRNFTKND